MWSWIIDVSFLAIVIASSARLGRDMFEAPARDLTGSAVIGFVCGLAGLVAHYIARMPG